MKLKKQNGYFRHPILPVYQPQGKYATLRIEGLTPFSATSLVKHSLHKCKHPLSQLKVVKNTCCQLLRPFASVPSLQKLSASFEDAHQHLDNNHYDLHTQNRFLKQYQPIYPKINDNHSQIAQLYEFVYIWVLTNSSITAIIALVPPTTNPTPSLHYCIY